MFGEEKCGEFPIFFVFVDQEHVRQDVDCSGIKDFHHKVLFQNVTLAQSFVIVQSFVIPYPYYKLSISLFQQQRFCFCLQSCSLVRLEPSVLVSCSYSYENIHIILLVVTTGAVSYGC